MPVHLTTITSVSPTYNGTTLTASVIVFFKHVYTATSESTPVWSDSIYIKAGNFTISSGSAKAISGSGSSSGSSISFSLTLADLQQNMINGISTCYAYTTSGGSGSYFGFNVDTNVAPIILVPSAPVISIDIANQLLSWPAVSGATSYEIIISNGNNTSYGAPLDIGNTTSISIGLGTTITYWKVRARNSAGVSGYSNEVNGKLSYVPNVNDVVLTIQSISLITGGFLEVFVSYIPVIDALLGQSVDLYLQTKSSSGGVLELKKSTFIINGPGSNLFTVASVGGTQTLTLESYMWLAGTATAVAQLVTDTFTPALEPTVKRIAIQTMCGTYTGFFDDVNYAAWLAANNGNYLSDFLGDPDVPNSLTYSVIGDVIAADNTGIVYQNIRDCYNPLVPNPPPTPGQPTGLLNKLFRVGIGLSLLLGRG